MEENEKTKMRIYIIVLIYIGMICNNGCKEKGYPEPPTSMEVSTILLNFQTSGGEATFNITSNTDWEIKVSDETGSRINWLSVSEITGSNNCRVIVTVTSNTSTSERTATITISGGEITRIINVKQAELVPYLTVSVDSMSFSSSAAERTFSITSNISWTVSKNPTYATWLSFSRSSGSNNETITVKADSATTNTERKASIIVSSNNTFGITHTIDVMQEGGDWYLNISTDTLIFSSSTETKTFTISSNTNWVLECIDHANSVWLSFKDRFCNHTYSNNETIVLLVTQNTSTSERSANIRVGSNATGTREITVKQATAVPTLTVSPISLSFSAILQQDSIENEQPFFIRSNKNWTVESDATWLKLSRTSGSPTTSYSPYYASVYVTCESNISTTSDRTASIIVRAEDLTETVTVTQSKMLTSGSIAFWTNRNWGSSIFVRLSGYETKYIDGYYMMGSPFCGSQYMATYTDLPFGTYNYTYSGIGPSGIWEEGSGSVTLSINCRMVKL